MRIYGYHRVSSKQQNLDRGITELESFSKDKDLDIIKIFTDKQTGKNFERPGYTLLKEIIQKGDWLVITEMDRLGRDKLGIKKELEYFKNAGIRVIILEIPTTYSILESNESSELIIDMLNNMLIEVFTTLAQQELIKKEKRQKEGIAAMKLRGEFDKYGRPSIEDSKFVEVQSLVDSGMSVSKACKQIKIGRTSYYAWKKLN